MTGIFKTFPGSKGNRLGLADKLKERSRMASGIRISMPYSPFTALVVYLGQEVGS